MTTNKDYYKILGVERDDDTEVIKAAYRKLAKLYHPDVATGDAAKMADVNEAYETLKDPQKRAAYDKPNPFANSFQWQTYRARSHDDLFNEIFSNFGFGRQEVRNRNITIAYTLSLEEAFKGKDITARYQTPDGNYREVLVRIPAGVDNGSRFRVEGAGDNSLKHLPPGDLYVTIRVNDHPIFIRAAQTLNYLLRVDALDAITGTTAEIPTIDGTTLRITVPAGSQPGDRLRVPQKGMTVLGSTLRGDMFVVVEVTVPRNLPDDVVNKLREIKSSILSTNVRN